MPWSIYSAVYNCDWKKHVSLRQTNPLWTIKHRPCSCAAKVAQLGEQVLSPRTESHQRPSRKPIYGNLMKYTSSDAFLEFRVRWYIDVVLVITLRVMFLLLFVFPKINSKASETTEFINTPLPSNISHDICGFEGCLESFFLIVSNFNWINIPVRS